MSAGDRPALSVEVRPTLGTDIAVVAAEMIRLAEQFGTCVRASFNGTPIYARPGDSADDVLTFYAKTRQRVDKPGGT